MKRTIFIILRVPVHHVVDVGGGRGIIFPLMGVMDLSAWLGRSEAVRMQNIMFHISGGNSLHWTTLHFPEASSSSKVVDPRQSRSKAEETDGGSNLVWGVTYGVASHASENTRLV